MSRILVCVLVGAALAQVACAINPIIKDKDYESSEALYRQKDVAGALQHFPTGEQGGFITSVEKSWLSLWSGQWNLHALQKQVKTFDQRKFISVSREAEYFLMQESEEGYVPAEHEVVLLHLISAIDYMKNHDNENAAVELRSAGYLLDHYWDDPALRLWLGTLWAADGHWNEAQVDFREANNLAPNMALHRLAEGPQPKQLTLSFYGVAPVIKWKDGAYAPEFLPDFRESIDDSIKAPTLPWFQHHLHRNTVLRDTLVKSNFMAQYLGGEALTATARGMTKAATWSLKAGTIALGVVVIGGTLYAVAQSGGSGGGSDGLAYIVGGEAALFYGLWKMEDQLDDHLQSDIDEDERHKQQDLRIYRMVRFLPTWVAVGEKSVTPEDDVKTVDLAETGSITHVVLVNHF